MRWTEVTEEGFRGGPVMPDNYDGSPAAIEQLRATSRAPASSAAWSRNDFKSSMIFVPLLDSDPSTGERIDYRALSQRARADAATRKSRAGTAASSVHVIGFAKLVGDLIDGLVQVTAYFALAALIATAIIYALHALRAHHGAGDGLLAGRRGVAAGLVRAASASSSIRTRSWCRSWCSRSA